MRPTFSRPELIRWAVLAGAGLWLLHPFFSSRLIGTGDALWYANMLGDFVTQWRAGVFPVFVGQSDFAFNGAVYPLRAAPFYQHLAGVIDLLTGQRFGFYTLQHACVVVCGFAGLFGTYLSLTAINPVARWPACLLAILFLSCPGVLGTIYTQDLYMTWMAVPFMPVAIYGVVRSYEKDDLAAQGLIAAGLAALWFAHAPVALWTTFLAGASQLVRLACVHPGGASWRRALLGGGVFVLLANYPFVSIASLGVPGTAPTVSGSLAEPERIMEAIRSVFPAVLRPLGENARSLSDLQLGYAWWAALAFGLALAVRRDASQPLRVLVGASIALLLLLLPVPGFTAWVWDHLPGQVIRITYYWPMHRFYLLLAALLAAAVQLGGRRLNPRWQRLMLIGLVAGCSWSLWEARQFVRAGRERTASLEASVRSQLPENRLLMNHSYGLLPGLPDYFSNGVMDYRAESRLLDEATFQPLAPAPVVEPTEKFTGVLDANPGVVVLRPTLKLEPGRRYELRFEFEARDYAGILQLTGPTFFRQYVLPESGRPRAFGIRPDNARSLWLWTTAGTAEEITLRFIPTGSAAAASYADFARFTFRELADDDAVVRTVSLIPYRAQLPTHPGAWLETPRVFIPGYVATIDNHPCEPARSPNGLVMIPVQPGDREVNLSYSPPFPLRLSYFLTPIAWVVLVLMGGMTFRQSRASATRARVGR